MSIKNTLETAKKLGITLKNLKTFPGHDGMEAFDTDICVDGKQVLHAYDSAHGGCYEFNPVKGQDYREAREVEAELEEKFKAFPKHDTEMGGGRIYSSRDTLECIIGALVSDHSYQKQLKKDTKKGLLIEKDNGYEIIKWNKTLPTMIKQHGDKMIAIIQKKYDETIAKKEVVLNLEYLKSIGIKI
ncbi:MAG: hypothetical protein ACTSX1_12480 [Candidatus Heimdallarchaeaceae archaeon]